MARGYWEVYMPEPARRPAPIVKLPIGRTDDVLRDLVAEVAALRAEVRGLQVPAPTSISGPGGGAIPGSESTRGGSSDTSDHPCCPDASARLEQLLLSDAMRGCIAYHAERPNGWSKRTVYVTEHAYKQALEIIGDKPAAAFSLDDVDRLADQVARSKWSPHWQVLLRSRVKVLVKFLIRRRILPADITLTWERTKIRADDHVRIFHDFTREEIEALCRFLRPAIVRYVWVACLTGLRQANLIDMKWSWIDANWILEVPAALYKQRRAFRFPIVPALQAILAPRGAPDEKVIPGVPTRSKILMRLKSAARRAGLNPRWAYSHNFRRTCCAWLKKSGVTHDQAQTLMGWSSAEVMLSAYWPRTDDAERRSIAEKLEKIGRPPESDQAQAVQ